MLEHYETIDLSEAENRLNLKYVLNKMWDLDYKILQIIPGFGRQQDYDAFFPIIVMEHQIEHNPCSDLETLTHYLVPDGMEHIRELDQEMAELMALGLIEKKDCGYAIAS